MYACKKAQAASFNNYTMQAAAAASLNPYSMLQAPDLHHMGAGFDLTGGYNPHLVSKEDEERRVERRR
jgi:hypothetical protein